MIKKISLTLTIMTLSSGQAFADDLRTSPWLARMRAIDVAPSASSSTITGLGGHVDEISNDIVPEVDISYFFTQQVAAEIILGTTKNDVSATGTSIGTVNLGSVQLIPATVTLQYHFLPDKIVNPYVGAGVNYTYFYGVDSGSTASSINYSNSFGSAFQVGADIAINKHWLINVDVKKIFMQTCAHVNVGADTYTSTVDINPMVYGIGLGYRF